MPRTLLTALRRHWPEYLIEAGGIAVFMVSALSFATLLEHPDSPVHGALPHPLLRRALMGLAMALTAISLVYSPWGKQSGAHFNPSVTFTFFRLGKIEPADAFFYGVAQLLGAIVGVTLAGLALGALVAHPHVRFALTLPGNAGELVAFLAEAAISFGLMLVVLGVSNSSRFARYTGLCCGLLVATYITFEAPISGMSMNPARSLGSAAGAAHWSSLWIYFFAPPLGMLLAAEGYTRLGRARRVHCAKLDHASNRRCIFRCGYHRAD
jgi:aquaporin Z